MNGSNKIFIGEDLYYTVKRVKNRIICIPSDELKLKQRFFLNAIKWVYPYSTDILKVAQIHSGKKWILKMDIKSFYDSVPLPQIEKVVKSVCKRISNDVSVTQLVNLVTLNGKLPTGAPTSAHIANACFKPIDIEIFNACRIYNVDFSRYVDDLTFSSYCKETLNIIEKRVKNILKYYGYELNNKKTKFISDNKQQNVLGLVVNNYQVRLPKEFKRKIRAMLHNYAIHYGYLTQKESKHLIWNEHSDQQLAGYMAFIKHVDKTFYKQLKYYTTKLSLKYHALFICI